MVWKKLPNTTEWYKHNNRFSFVRVWKIGLPSSERRRRGIGLYGVMGRIGRSGTTNQRTFKTRTLALDWAKNYMRRNK